MKRTCALMVLAFLSSLLGCATSTGYIPPSQEAISGIQRLAVKVNEFPEFIFIDKRNELDSFPIAFAGVLPYAVYLHASNSLVKNKIKPRDKLSPEDVFISALRTSFSDESHDFQHLDIFETRHAKIPEINYDAIAIISIDRWGVVTRTDKDTCTLLVDAKMIVRRVPGNVILINDAITVSRDTNQSSNYYLQHPQEIETELKAMFEEMGRRVGKSLINS